MEKFYVMVEERHCNSPDCRGVCDAMYLASEADARIAELEKLLRFASCYVTAPGWTDDCQVRKMRARIESALDGVVRFSDQR